MRRSILLITLAGSIGWGPSAGAEPRFAVREGMQCGGCHVNRTGGGMRTEWGALFSQRSLPTWTLQDVFDPNAGRSLAFGGDLRLANRTLFNTQTRFQGKSQESAAKNTFEITEGNLYFRADAVKNRVIFYLDETMAPEGASAREAFVMLAGLPLGGYLKAGRMLLPYGLRLPDDFAFVRQETGFTYANQDLGLEVGGEVGPATLAIAVSNGSLGGSDPNLEKQLTARAEVVGKRVRAGASFAWNDTSTDDFSLQTRTAGGHVGARLGRLELISELDWIHGEGDAEAYDQVALYTETDFEALRGLYLRFIFEAFDPLIDLDNNERDRFSLGFSWFPVQLFEIRGEYRINRDIPQRVGGNVDEILVEIHGFL